MSPVNMHETTMTMPMHMARMLASMIIMPTALLGSDAASLMAPHACVRTRLTLNTIARYIAASAASIHPILDISSSTAVFSSKSSNPMLSSSFAHHIPLSCISKKQEIPVFLVARLFFPKIYNTRKFSAIPWRTQNYMQTYMDNPNKENRLSGVVLEKLLMCTEEMMPQDRITNQARIHAVKPKLVFMR